MISVVICRPAAGNAWEIDEWLMSCRVLGRRVENMVLREVLDHAMRHNIQRLIGVYRPTERNKLVQLHYKELGFHLLESLMDGITFWELQVANAVVHQPA